MNTIVTEMTEHGETAVDVFQKLSDNRILFVVGEIDDDMAADIVATLVLKDCEDSDEKITMFINSQGGEIRNVLAIYDAMCMVEAPIETVCIGSAMHSSVILLAAGTKGMRIATKHSVICAEQLVNEWMKPSDLTDAETSLAQTLDDNKKMMSILAKTTGKTIKKVMSDFNRKVFMNSSQALEYGFIDKVV